MIAPIKYPDWLGAPDPIKSKRELANRDGSQMYGENSSSAKPKTPYQLDLEVKDRKPSIIPKVGDMVKIKSREWYEKWSKDNPFDSVDVRFGFVSDMSNYCGHVMTVSKVLDDKFYLKEDQGFWGYSLEMFEEVCPVQEQLSSKFPRIDLSGAIQPLPNCLGGELVLSKEEQERLKQQLREKWGVKPKLKQIKTTHLIKLKKL